MSEVRTETPALLGNRIVTILSHPVLFSLVFAFAVGWAIVWLTAVIRGLPTGPCSMAQSADRVCATHWVGRYRSSEWPWPCRSPSGPGSSTWAEKDRWWSAAWQEAWWRSTSRDLDWW